MSTEKGAFVDATARLNVPFRYLQDCIPLEIEEIPETMLPDHIHIGPYSLIGKGVKLGSKVVIDAYCSVESETEIGEGTLITYRASIGGSAKIGKNCVIGGFVPENCIIGDNCRIFGNLVHSHVDSTMSWDFHSVPEKSVTIGNNSFIGFGAIVTGGFSIGSSSYICAGAVVTREVPSYHIAFGVNKVIHYSEWQGELKNNPIFKL